MLEPQGTFFFLLLMIAFALLVFWAVMTKQVVFRVLASVLAFVPAMAFGVAAVNKYYDYYQTWGGLVSDLTNQPVQGLTNESAAGLKSGKIGNQANDEQFGTTASVNITGPQSGISRKVYIWLPPQYFQASYKTYRFPAIELLHGSPGQPSSWIDVMNVIAIYLQLMAQHEAKPAVLVMPDTDGGLQYGLQCLNYPGLQDMTYLGLDVPNYVSHNLRVQPLGRAWGIAGYSEGGFCAANIGLQEPWKWGAVGSLSGYFTPIASQVPARFKQGGRPVRMTPYANNPALRVRNTPSQYLLHMPYSVELPHFFLAAGAQDTSDVTGARIFRNELQLRVTDVPLQLIPGGHQGKVWRAALFPMLQWMTGLLAQNVSIAQQHGPRHVHHTRTPQPVKHHTPPPQRKPKHG